MRSRNGDCSLSRAHLERIWNGIGTILISSAFVIHGFNSDNGSEFITEPWPSCSTTHDRTNQDRLETPTTMAGGNQERAIIRKYGLGPHSGCSCGAHPASIAPTLIPIWNY